MSSSRRRLKSPVGIKLNDRINEHGTKKFSNDFISKTLDVSLDIAGEKLDNCTGPIDEEIVFDIVKSVHSDVLVYYLLPMLEIIDDKSVSIEEIEKKSLSSNCSRESLMQYVNSGGMKKKAIKELKEKYKEYF